MPNNNLTGTENLRLQEIQRNWFTFEPTSIVDHSIKFNLFTVPLGQTIEPELLIDYSLGSGSFVSGAILIEKEIHTFDDETEARRFIEDIGAENIISFTEKKIETSLGAGLERIVQRTEYEIQVVNLPKITISMDLRDFEISDGFYINLYKSSSEGLQKVSKEIKKDSQGRIISDTYLKFFKLRDDNA